MILGEQSILFLRRSSGRWSGYGSWICFDGRLPTKRWDSSGKVGSLGLFKAPQMPSVETHLIEKNNPDSIAFGGKGIGEIVCCMGAPACQNAYYKKDGIFRYSYPLDNTYYRKPKPAKTAERVAPKDTK